MFLNTSPKSFNQCRMQLPDGLHGLGSAITSLPSSSIFTGYLSLNELNSRFYYLLSKHCISKPQSIFKTLSLADSPSRLSYTSSRLCRSSSMLNLNPVSFNPKTYDSRAFSISAPELWNKLPNNIHPCENLSLFKHKLKTYLFENFYFSQDRKSVV